MASWYVSGNGNDSDSGTQASPFATVKKGAEVAQPGDTVFIRGGFTYAEYVSLPRSGTSGNLITFKPEPATGTVTMRHSSSTTPLNQAVFEGFNRSYIRIEAIRFENSTSDQQIKFFELNTSVDFVTVLSRCVGNEISGCTFESCGNDVRGVKAFNHAILLTGNEGALVENCTFNNCRGNMVDIGRAYNCTIRDCTATNLVGAITGSDLIVRTTFSNFGTGGAAPEGTFTPGSGLKRGGFHTYENNTVRDSDVTGAFANGIRGDASAHNTLIKGCTVSGLGRGIFLESRANFCTVEQCILRDNDDFGILSAGPFVGVATDCVIQNNVMYNNAKKGLVVRLTQNWTIKNNIFMDNGQAQVLVTEQGVGVGNVFNNNLYFDSGSSLVNAWNCALIAGNDANCRNSVVADLNLASWNTNSGETDSLGDDPLFVSLTPGSEDFHLQAGSPAIDAGEGGIDMGAFPTDPGTQPPPPPPISPDDDPMAVRSWDGGGISGFLDA